MTYAKALVDNARHRTLYLRIWPSPIFECALVLIAHISLGREPKPETLANVRFRAHNGLKSDIAPCPKSARSGLLTDKHLPLALDNALKRMLMFAGKGDHLHGLCLSYFVRVSPALGGSFTMNAEHETDCTFAIHVEELFDGVHNKFHW